MVALELERVDTWRWSACEYMALELDELAVVDITGAFDIS